MPDCASRIWDVDAAADYAVGLLLWLDRSVSERELHKNEKKWRRDVSISPPYHALSLMKVGLLGLDAVAEGVIRRLRPFGCEIVVCAPGQEDAISALGCESVTREALFATCDAVSVHTHVEAGQPPAVTARDLSTMVPTAWFINITQAEAVEESALVAVVCENRIAGAALDVFWQEPLPAEHPLLGRHDVILTPRMADAVTQEEVRKDG